MVLIPKPIFYYNSNTREMQTYISQQRNEIPQHPMNTRCHASAPRPYFPYTLLL